MTNQSNLITIQTHQGKFKLELMIIKYCGKYCCKKEKDKIEDEEERNFSGSEASNPKYNDIHLNVQCDEDDEISQRRSSL